MHLDADPTDEQILQFVEAWIDDLARGDYEAAYSRIAHDPHYEWTPELIRQVIEGYGLPEPHPRGVFQVTPRNSTDGSPHYRMVDRETVPPGAFAYVLHDLPLNGAWSDLTATFRLERKENRSEIILEEIHVF